MGGKCTGLKDGWEGFMVTGLDGYVGSEGFMVMVTGLDGYVEV